MSFLEALKLKKSTLKATNTTITYPDGRQIIKNANGNIVENRNSTIGFVVDTKPDMIPACILKDKLYLGSQDAIEPTILAENQITHVLSIGIESPINLSELSIKGLFIPCLDLPETDFTPTLEQAIQFINESLFDDNIKGRVLVHCNAGVSRSSSVIIGYLIKSKNMSFEDAYNLVKLKRECIQPNAGFLKQLKTLSL